MHTPISLREFDNSGRRNGSVLRWFSFRGACGTHGGLPVTDAKQRPGFPTAAPCFFACLKVFPKIVTRTFFQESDSKTGDAMEQRLLGSCGLLIAIVFTSQPARAGDRKSIEVHESKSEMFASSH